MDFIKVDGYSGSTYVTTDEKGRVWRITKVDDLWFVYLASESGYVTHAPTLKKAKAFVGVLAKR